MLLVTASQVPEISDERMNWVNQILFLGYKN